MLPQGVTHANDVRSPIDGVQGISLGVPGVAIDLQWTLPPPRHRSGRSRADWNLGSLEKGRPLLGRQSHVQQNFISVERVGGVASKVEAFDCTLLPQGS